MLAPSLRGRIVALEIFFLSSWSSIQSQVMIAVKSTRFDEGHAIAWYVEQDGYNRTGQRGFTWIHRYLTHPTIPISRLGFYPGTD